MVGKGEGTGEGTIGKLENQINVLKFTLLFTNVIIWMIGATIFALCLWLRFEPGLEEWIEKLELGSYYTGVYILLFTSIIIMAISFLGCLSVFQENPFTLNIFAGTQIFSFIVGAIGASFLLEYSTKDSLIEPLIRESMRRLIINSHHQLSRDTLYMVQENVGCCGADGPRDYLDLRQPLPNQCRDTVTGNPYYHGCVDELIWFFEEKAIWITGLTMAVCLMHIMNAAMSIILGQAIKKEEDEAAGYRR